MSCVTARIYNIKQPYGGYLNISKFDKIQFDDGCILGQDNIPPQDIGITVDYLTRFMCGEKIEEAFKISIAGFNRMKSNFEFFGESFNNVDPNFDIYYLLNQIKGLDNNSIIAACKVSTYDVWFRASSKAENCSQADDIMPDEQTIENIRILVNRSIAFWDKYGPIKYSGFTFERNGYSSFVNSGDGDYLTEDTLWDIKVTKDKPTSKHTLQILMYWIMGQHSQKDMFKTNKKIGIFNPRLNAAYILDTSKIDKKIITDVENDVIRYNCDLDIKNGVYERLIPIQTATGKDYQHLDIIYDNNYDINEASFVTVIANYDGRKIKVSSKNYPFVDAFAKMQKQLPDNVKLMCCAACRHGNLCPVGSSPDELFCTKDVSISCKNDLLPYTENESERKKRLKQFTDSCKSFKPQSSDFYTYSDYLSYLKEHE